MQGVGRTLPVHGSKLRTGMPQEIQNYTKHNLTMLQGPACSNLLGPIHLHKYCKLQ